MKINNFQGELTDSSAEEEALPAMQGGLQRACVTAAQTAVLAYLDDVHLVGKPDQARLAFHALQRP